MEFNEIDKRLDVALALLIEKDSVLFERNVIETSISHKLGCYLQGLFPNFDVDCEYNKYGDGDKQSEYGPDIRPDIAIHKRGSEGPNLVVLEMKPGSLPNYDDEVKLMELTDQRGRYRYQYGFFVGFTEEQGMKKPIKYLYQNGSPR